MSVIVGLPLSHPTVLGCHTERPIEACSRRPSIWCPSTLVTAELLLVTAHRSPKAPKVGPSTESALSWLQGFCWRRHG